MRALASGHAPFVLCGLVGGWLRTTDLGRLPLSAREAAGGWAAWSAVTGASSAIAVPDPQPASAVLFGLQFGLFQLLGDGDALARLAPAALGTAALVVPWLLRARLGQVSAVALAVLMALDPIAIALARTADGAALTATAVWAMTAGLLVLQDARPTNQVAGWPLALTAAAAVAVASGPLAWDALPLLALVAGRLAATVPEPRPRLLMAGLGFLIAMALSTTGFVQTAAPPLVSLSVTEWLARWHVASGHHASTLGVQLLRQETLALALGLGGLVVVFPRRHWWRVAIWIVWAAALTARPGRGLDAWLVLSPPVLLLAAGAVAWLAATIRQAGSRVALASPSISAAAVAVLCLFMARAAVGVATDVTRDRPGEASGDQHTERSVRALAAAVAERQRRAEPRRAAEIVVVAPAVDAVVGWYLRQERRVRWVQPSAGDAGAEARMTLDIANPEARGPDIFAVRHDAAGLVQVRLR